MNRTKRFEACLDSRFSSGIAGCSDIRGGPSVSLEWCIKTVAYASGRSVRTDTACVIRTVASPMFSVLSPKSTFTRTTMAAIWMEKVRNAEQSWNTSRHRREMDEAFVCSRFAEMKYARAIASPMMCSRTYATSIYSVNWWDNDLLSVRTHTPIPEISGFPSPHNAAQTWFRHGDRSVKFPLVA